MSWSSRDRHLSRGSVYKSNDIEHDPFHTPCHHFIFLTLQTWMDQKRILRARVLILDSENERIFPVGSVQDITPSYWIWTSAERIS